MVKVKVISVFLLKSVNAVMMDVELLNKDGFRRGDVFVSESDPSKSFEIISPYVHLKHNDIEEYRKRQEANLHHLGVQIPDYDPKIWVGRVFIKQQYKVMDQQTENELINQGYGVAARLLSEGSSEMNIRKHLINMGLNDEKTSQIIRDINQDVNSSKHKERATTHMFWGGILFVISASLTLATYLMAEDGDTYVITWGAMFFGAAQFSIGLVLKLLSKK